jgi:hypothetical protein
LRYSPGVFLGIGETLKASTAQVPHGAEYSPGLKEALASR